MIGDWGTRRLISNTGAYDRANTTTGGIANTMYNRGVGVGSTGGLNFANTGQQQRLQAFPTNPSANGEIAGAMARTGTPVSGATPGYVSAMQQLSQSRAAQGTLPSNSPWRTPEGMNTMAGAMGSFANSLRTGASPPIIGTGMPQRAAPVYGSGSFGPAPPGAPPPPNPAAPVAPSTLSGPMAPDVARSAMLAGLGYSGARSATPEELAAAGWGGVYGRMANPG